jgi:hypothetical protein|tara:strand:+ start:795 stop:1187 length:393 start_codon:yes stop_codon:yes gene_type:complete
MGNIGDSLGLLASNEGKMTINKERILDFSNRPYKRPGDFKEIEKGYNGVLIWGDENPEELLNKIISQDTQQLKQGVGLLIFSTIDLFKPNEVRECFNLLKKHDEELYNSFGENFLKNIGLKIVKKGWKFW